MIAQTFPLKQLVKMFRSSELKVVPIVSGSGEVGVPPSTCCTAAR